MSYATARDALLSVLDGLPGIQAVYGYQPATLTPPSAYVLFDSNPRSQSGQVVTNHYRVLIRVCLRWLDYEEAELDLANWINAVPALVDKHVRLVPAPNAVNAFTANDAQIAQTAGFFTLGKILYRVLDTYVTLRESGPYQGEI